MTPKFSGLNYYWMPIAPYSTPQIVGVINSGKRGHRVLFMDSAFSLSAAEFEEKYPDAKWGQRLQEPKF